MKIPGFAGRAWVEGAVRLVGKVMLKLCWKWQSGQACSREGIQREAFRFRLYLKENPENFLAE